MRLEGIEVMNPVTHKPLPMFVSDYVLMGYGTGIVMGVPGHDQRDWEFAKSSACLSSRWWSAAT